MKENLSITQTLYLDGYQYVNGNLEFFPVAGAYVKKTESTGATKERWYDYVFNYTDHLGNIRLSYTLDYNTNKLKTLEENHYYPFGLKHRKYNNLLSDIQFKPNISNRGLMPIVKGKTYKYKYNGKELQDELGLNVYDYGARNYDASLGRWISVDPLAEKYPNISPYAYVANNPINAIDPDGRYIIFIGGLRLLYGARDQAGHTYNGLGGKTGIYKTDVFDFYWSTKPGKTNTFGREANISQYYMNKYDDTNVGFTSGSSFWSSQASDRRLEGMEKAKLFHKMVQDGDIKLKDGETIKIISHSQGGAHAAGYAEQLMSYKDDNNNPIYNIEVMEYITPHQPTDIDHPDGILGIQYSHENDQISSRNYLPNGGTKFGRIFGIDRFYHGNIMGEKGQPRANIFTRGGHNVTDNDKFIKKGE